MNFEENLIRLNKIEVELNEYQAENELMFQLLEQLYEMLIWCGGSEDFQEGGKARIGWEKGAIPTLERTGKYLKGLRKKYEERRIQP